mmetsp:Transcript_5228/g.15516  ORF Transcript_5228/g.15516 Transcript_5228/m.15516 type:complete len:108 (-) Transcript_5228:635-958(-)
MNQLLRLALAATLAPLVHPFLTPAPAAGRAHARPLSVLADAATSSITTISGNNLKMTDAMRARAGRADPVPPGGHARTPPPASPRRAPGSLSRRASPSTRVKAISQT